MTIFFRKLIKYAFVVFFVLPAGLMTLFWVFSDETNTHGVSEIPKPTKSNAVIAQAQHTPPSPPKPDCNNFDSHIVKLAPANTGKWSQAVRDSEYCFKKTKNTDFKKLVTRYRKKLKKVNAKKREEKALQSKIGPKPLRAAAKAYIKKIARDPASVRDIECSSATPSSKKDAWVQTCNFRGKNALGGYVQNQLTVRIRENVVVGVEK